MAEYILSYTAEEINENLGLVVQNKENIDKIREDLNVVNEDIKGINENILELDGNKVPTTRTINGKALNEDVVLLAEDINAEESGSVAKGINDHNVATDSHTDIREAIEDINEGVKDINVALEGKADVEHTHNYAEVDHAHDNYAEVDHVHDYADKDHTHPGQEEFSENEPSGQVTGDYWMKSY